MTLLTADRLTVRYGAIAALHDISLAIPPATIVTVIGPNGAGKTTLLNALMGTHPGTGPITFEGNNLARQTPEQRVALGISLVPEKRELFPSMPVDDNLRLGFWRRRHEGRTALATALAEAYAAFPRLQERRRQPAGTLSGGERQMLAIARALMARPTLLMLDEPSLGLAPLIVRDILATVAALRATGRAILLVEQNARAALAIADYAYVLETGRIALEGPAPTLAHDPRIMATYLGIAP